VSGTTDKRVATRRALSDPGVRAAARRSLHAQYERGASVRQLVRATGYAYGTVHTLLVEAGTAFRDRGRPGGGA
jgi:hypothetical protein